MQPYLIVLLAKGLTSLVLALFGPGFPSAPPFMEWVYAVALIPLTIFSTLTKKQENSSLVVLH